MMKYISSALKPELVAVGKLALLGCTVALFSACGGGSSSPLVPAPVVPVPVPVAVIDPLEPVAPIDFALAQASLSVASDGVGGDGGGDGGAGGAAGDGAALRRATIVLTDVTGKTLIGQTDDAGNYLIRYKTADIKPPFVMKVISAGGNVLSAPSEATIPAGKVARININPLTDKITSDILASTVAGTDKQFNGGNLNLALLPQAKANLVTSIRAALTSAGVTTTTAFDPITSKYAYDGIGVDAVIESISLTRNPSSGSTQLQAKLAPLIPAADGTVSPTFISATAPLATTQVALPTSQALTFAKLKAWVDNLNGCLMVTRPAGLNCADLESVKYISASYKQNSKDFDEDFNLLFSETGRGGVRGSEIRNPSILFKARSAGSTVDDIAVVEVTIRQPRTGPLANSIATPIEYTKTLVFRRDDSTPGLVAGNWILNGNQRNFAWGVLPSYFTAIQQNPVRNATDPSGSTSRTASSVLLNFSSRVFNTTTRMYDSAGVYAVRLKGPGLPAVGVVFVPTLNNTFGILQILNKTGVIPPEGTTTAIANRDFRVGQASYPTGAVRSSATWPGANPTYADTQDGTDFSKLQAFNSYTAEIYVNGSTAPIVETTRILAPVEPAANYVQRPLHDLTPSLALIKPPLATSTSVNASWIVNPLAAKITSAYFYYEEVLNGRGFTSSAGFVAGGLGVNLIQTSISIPIAQGTAPAFNVPPATGSREVGLSGTSSRASFQQSINWSN